jgi:hypothetical protein
MPFYGSGKTHFSMKILSMLGLSLGLIACHSMTTGNEERETDKVENTSVRLNGYYYSLNAFGSLETPPVYYFYQDGVMLSIGAIAKSKLINAYEYRPDSISLQKIRNWQPSWNTYEILGDSIVIHWHATQGGEIYVYPRKGVILNDSTFVITKITTSRGMENLKDPEIFNFVRSEFKPDSTNTFFK